MADENMPAAGPTEPQAVPPVQEPAGYAPAAPASNKGISLIVGAVVLVAVGVGGYGFWNGTQVKSYANKAGKAHTEAKEWNATLNDDIFGDSSLDSVTDESSLEDLTDSLVTKKAELEKIKAASEKNIADLSKSVPGKAKTLSDTQKQYYTLTKKMSEEQLYGIAMTEGATEFIKDILSMESFYTTETVDEQAALGQVKKGVDSWIASMKKVTVPESMKEYHDALLETLNEFSDALAKGDYEALTNMSEPWAELDTDKFDNEYNSNLSKIDELYTKADSQVKNLQGLGMFVF